VTAFNPAPKRIVERLRSLAGLMDRFGLPACGVMGFIFGVGQALQLTNKPIDFILYWRATNFADLYPPDWLSLDYGYVYPPPLAQLLYPFHVLPFDVAAVMWSVVCFLSLWYSTRAWALPVIVLGFAGAALDLPRPTTIGLEYALLGNIQWPIVAAIVASARWSGWWAMPLLTKIGVGVGVLWPIFRREWRDAATAIGTTLAVCLVSFLLTPAAWFEFFQFIIDNYGGPSLVPIVGPPFPVRLAIAVGLVLVASRTDRRWLVYIACGLAIPALYEWSFVPFWLAAIRTPDGWALPARREKLS
jgi:hypothetical protein